MRKTLIRSWLCFSLCLTIGACASLTGVIFPGPNSRHPQLYSATTGVPLFPNERWPQRTFHFEEYPKDFSEARIFRFAPCADTADQAFGRFPRMSAEQRSHLEGPGAVWLTGQRYIDEAEVSNLEWQVFLNCLLNDSTEAVYQHYFPTTAAQPVPDYFTNSFYRYYPVVGISYAQAQGFCRWRGAVVTEQVAKEQANSSSGKSTSSRQRFVYRLPTEGEWEFAAGIFTGWPYGTACPTRRLYVNPAAADYLRRRSQSNLTRAQIRQDIQKFNASKTSITWLNCRREGPYFLQSPTPDYVYGQVVNSFGIFNLLGNVAELVQEPGVTKGGSYRDPLSACTIRARGIYSGPAPTVGFRCVFDAQFTSQTK